MDSISLYRFPVRADQEKLVFMMSYYAIFLASSTPGDESATKSKVQGSSSADAPGDESATKSKVQGSSSAAAQS